MRAGKVNESVLEKESLILLILCEKSNRMVRKTYLNKKEILFREWSVKQSVRPVTVSLNHA